MNPHPLSAHGASASAAPGVWSWSRRSKSARVVEWCDHSFVIVLTIKDLFWNGYAAY